MVTHTSLPNDKLYKWFLATWYAEMVLENRISTAKDKHWPCEYDQRQLECLVELKEFLDLSWTSWMDSMEDEFRRVSALLKEVEQ